MTRDEILKQYRIRNGCIVSPGKFEGEPLFTPHFWQLGLEGFADDDDRRGFFFRIKKGDLVEFPELRKWVGRRRSLRLSEDDQGFVHCW